MQLKPMNILLSTLSMLLALGCGDSPKDGAVNLITAECGLDDCYLIANASLQNRRGEAIQEGLEADDFTIESLSVTLYDAPVDVQVSTARDLSYEETSEIASVALLLDQSSSMLGADGYGTRFDASRTLTSLLLDEVDRRHEMVLASFDASYLAEESLEYTDIWQGFTTEPTEIYDAISELEQIEPWSGTPLYRSIAELCPYMADHAADPENDLVIVVMTDGKDGGSDSVALDAALAHDVRFFIVGLGENPDHEELYPLALATGGTYVKANTDDLDAAFGGLAGALDKSVDVEINVTGSSDGPALTPGATYEVSGDLVYRNKLVMPFLTSVYVANLN